MKHRFVITSFYEGKQKLFLFIFIVFAGALSGLAGQSAYAVTCSANISPSVSCSDLVISGSNLTLNVNSGLTITQTNPNPSISITASSGTSLGISGSIFSNDIGLVNTNVIDSLVINPSGSIYGYEYAIRNEGTINSLVNKNIISASPDSHDAAIDNFGTIQTLTNIGTVTGYLYNIWNGDGDPPTIGRYGTINNLQGQSGPLKYSGDLPSHYNIIIYSTSNYGKFKTAVSNGTMTFGIYAGGVAGVAASTITANIYQSVLINDGGGNPWAEHLAGLTGTYGAYTYSLVLHAGTAPGDPETWDLVVTLTPITPTNDSTTPAAQTSMTAGGTTSLSSIGVNSTPVFAGGTLTLAPGNQSSLNFLVTSAGGTITAPSTGTATLSGVFSGPGGLTFNGSGTTVLSGNNTFSGGTTIASGTLSVSGNSATGTGPVFVGAGGQLSGTGTISGALTVAGILKPGNSPGYLMAMSTVTMSNGSTYLQDIAGKQQADTTTPVGASGYYSFVNVGNQLVINSGATLTPRLSNLFTSNESGYGSAIYVPALGDRFRMVTATGGISGRFSTLTQPAELATGTQFIAFYNLNSSNSLDLAVTPTSYSSTLSSSTTNAKEVANVLDQLLGVNKTGAATAAQDSLLYAVAGQTAASLPGFAQSLSGEIHAASAATLPQTTQRVQQAVLARLGDFPMAPNQLGGGAGAADTPLSSGAITGNNPSGLPTANMSSNPAVNPKSANITSAAITDGRAWGEIAYQRGERSGNSGGNGYNNNLYQAVFGVDAYTNAALGLKLGGGLALSNTTVNATGGNSTIQQGALFVYGKMPVAEDYVLDGMVSLGLSSTKLSRSDITGISNGFSNKSVMGNDVLVSAGLSRPFETSDVRITPYVRLTYQYVGQASYDEGASAAALSVGRMNANGLRAVIGVGAGSLNKDPLKAGYTYRANVAIGAESQGLLNPTLNTTLGGYSSSVTTPTAGAGFVQAGLYGTVKVADSAYAYAGISAEARTGQTLYGGSVGLRVAF